jgi:hypothetical protein
MVVQAQVKMAQSRSKEYKQTASEESINWASNLTGCNGLQYFPYSSALISFNLLHYIHLKVPFFLDLS